MTTKNQMSRRSFVKSVAAGAGAASVPAALTGCISDDDKDDKDNTLSQVVFSFGHGVASGDPLADRVIIWSRITPDVSVGSSTVPVKWVVATDVGMQNVVSQGSYNTSRAKDLTIKVDVTGLNDNTAYYYQFTGPNGVTSPVGQTKTLPVGDVSKVSMAVCSCANFPYGTFNVYKEIANSDAQVVLHLGDYIYEYESGVYPETPAENRQLDPAQEIVTLDQYRARYNQYRRDSDLQTVHAAKPFICVWDDHELANDAYKDGAENHNEGEGDFAARREAALQAYHEWLPIRTGDDRGKIYRSFDFGDLLSLHMMDTRIIARDKPLDYSDYLTQTGIDAAAFQAALADQNRTLLGAEQQQSVVAAIFNSTAKWQVLGQQVLMGRIFVPQELLLNLATIQQTIGAGGDASSAQAATAAMLTELATIKGRILAGDPTVTAEERGRVEATAPYNLDAWDGYFPAREEILRRARLFNKKLVVLAGDTHNAWASELYEADDNANVLRENGPVGVEFATSSVTSPGFETYVGFGENTALQAGFEQAVTTLVDDLKYLNAANRGYMMVEITPEKASSEWRYVDSVSSTTYTASVGKKMEASHSDLTLNNVPLV
jgi:alkaline phosphatase D